MATRFYFPSSGSAAVTPSTWNFANQINPLTLKGVRTKITSTNTNKVEATGTTSPTARAMFRWVIGPLTAQTISGTVKGQMMGAESQSGANATLALAIKIIKPDGTDRGVLLAQTAPDTTTTPPELVVTTVTNRSFRNSAESAAPALTSQAATLGDYLVIEVGFRSATTTSRNITLRYGDELAGDLAENETATTDASSWIEFSGTITLTHTATATCTAGAATASVTVVYTPPTFTATIAPTAGAATSSATATFLDPLRTASVAGTAGAATASVSAAYSAGVFTAGISSSAGAATASVAAAFSGGLKTASVAASAAPATAMTTARYVAHPEGTFTTWWLILWSRTYGSFVQPPATYTAAVTATMGAATANVAVDFTTITYTAAISATAAPATAAVSARWVAYVPGNFTHWSNVIWQRPYGDFSTPGSSTASIAATVGAATASATTTFSPGVHTATVSESVGGATASVSVGYSGGIHTASIAGSAASATSSVSALSGFGIRIASVSATSPVATASVTATFAPGTHTVNDITGVVGAATASVAATNGFRTALVQAVMGAATLSASAEFTAPVYVYQEGAKRFPVSDRQSRFIVLDRKARFEVLNGNG